jgi:TonB family protein
MSDNFSSPTPLSVPNFGLLPSGERNRGAVAFAAIINVTVAILLVLLGLTAKTVLVQHKYEVTELTVPTTPPPVKIKIPPPPKIQPPKIEEVKVEPPKINLPRPVPIPEPKPIQMDVPKPQVQIAQTKQNVVLAPQPKAAMASSTPAPEQQTKQLVSAVHLGDPQGVRPDPNAVHGTVMATAFGSRDGVSGSTYGTVRSTGLGGQMAGNGGSGGSIGHVASAGIPTVQKVVASASFAPSQPQTTNLEILSKPAVQYTEEARQKRIQGNVVLNVTFMADGRVIVHKVVNGLGYGLDEEASRVAKEIRFHPATHAGQAIDLTTNITITFQLA